MQRYDLSSASYALLKSVDLGEMGNSISWDDFSESIQTDNIRMLLIILNEEINTTGLTEDQDGVNNRGRNLYDLYDELLAQKNNNKSYR